MAQSLWDHHRRLDDIERVIDVLRGMVAADPKHHPALREAVHKLNVKGAKGAAQLLTGDRVLAPYRR